MSDEKVIINNLLTMENLLKNTLIALKNANLERQFDYQTSNKLSLLVDTVHFLIVDINKIVYRK